jgi:hypothetical protein
MELTDEALDYPDCRPPRPLDEIGITLPPRLQKMLDERRAEKAREQRTGATGHGASAPSRIGR